MKYYWVYMDSCKKNGAFEVPAPRYVIPGYLPSGLRGSAGRAIKTAMKAKPLSTCNE